MTSTTYDAEYRLLEWAESEIQKTNKNLKRSL